MTPRLAIAVLLTAAFAMGAVNILAFDAVVARQPWRLIELLTLTLIAYSWVLLDARRLSFMIGWPTKASVIAIAVVAIPVYLYRSRGFRGGTLATLVFIGMLCLMLFSIVAGATFGRLMQA